MLNFWTIFFEVLLSPLNSGFVLSQNDYALDLYAFWFLIWSYENMIILERTHQKLIFKIHWFFYFLNPGVIRLFACFIVSLDRFGQLPSRKGWFRNRRPINKTSTISCLQILFDFARWRSKTNCLKLILLVKHNVAKSVDNHFILVQGKNEELEIELKEKLNETKQNEVNHK
jgi:hypothetical protein